MAFLSIMLYCVAIALALMIFAKQCKLGSIHRLSCVLAFKTSIVTFHKLNAKQALVSNRALLAY